MAAGRARGHFVILLIWNYHFICSALILCSGLLDLSASAENLRDFKIESDRVPTWIFPGAYVGGSSKKLATASFFEPVPQVLGQTRYAKLNFVIKLNTMFCLVAASVLAVVHVLSLQFFLYWHYLWLDIPMHALGGAVAALAVFVPYDFGAPLPRRWLQPLPVLLLVLLVALSWEVYEIMLGIPFGEDYVADTASDLGAAMLGGVTGFLVARRFYELSITP